MANDNYPRGLFPMNYPSIPVHYYLVATDSDIYLGQPVARNAAGYLVGLDTCVGAIGCLGVAVGFAGPNKAGIACDAPFLDVSGVPGNGATGDRWVAVADDPMQTFIVQEDTGSTALTVAAINAAFDLIFRGASGTVRSGDTNTGWATVELDRSTLATTTAGFVQLEGYLSGPNTDGTENAPGNYCKWLVRLLHHQNRLDDPGPVV